MNKIINLVILIICFPLLSLAQKPIAGLIPTFYSIAPAVDLIHNNELLDPEQAHLFAQNEEVDLSTLEPTQTTNLWSREEKETDDIITDFTTIPEVDYQSKLISRLGIFRFSATTKNRDVLNFSFGKKIHNFLLRKNILRKLGYHVPKIQYFKEINLNFETSIDRDIFIAKLADQTMADADRFILNKEETSLTLIDCIAMSSNTPIYNLALGTFPQHLVKGRRIIRAAYLPLALVDVPESVNMMPWQAGRVILKNIKLYHGQDLTNTYGPSIHDAKWITSKIAKLTRSDWSQIVQNAFYPKPVEKLIIEKVISRRNHLQELFIKPNPLEFNPLISHGKELLNGELLQESFTGYVDRFSFGDPDSPFSSDEMGYFFASKGISTAITNLIAQFNSMPFMAVDEQQKVKDHLQNLYKQKGMFYKSPLKAWFFPTAKGQLILSRDIITGSYMGTSNQVQLVDTIGGFVEAGVYMGVDGLDEVANVSGKTTLQYQRTYSHVKPIKTLKKALKEPFKNMLVPVLLNKLGKKINDEGQEPAQLAGLVKELKNKLSIGESFIITDSLGGSLSLDAHMSITSLFWMPPKLLKAYTQAMAKRIRIRRLHITRSDQNTIQIYNDQGKSRQLMFTFKLSSYVPVISINTRRTKGKAKTEFYSLDLSDHPSKLALNLNALRVALKRSSSNALQKVQRPYYVSHDFKEKGRTSNFLIWERNKIKSFDEISITHPKGGTKKFIRRYDALTKGKDIEGYATESISNLVSLIWDQDIFINQTSLTNPGYGIFGKASNEVIITEAERGEKSIKNKFTTAKILFNGWKAKRSKLLRIMKRLNRRFGVSFFNETSLQNTKSVLLYQLGVDIYISQEGHVNLFKLNESEIKRVIEKQTPNISEEQKQYMLTLITKLIAKIKLNETNYPKFAMKKTNKLISILLDNFDIKHLKMFFGEKGILFTARLEGFRQGDEMGDKPLISDTYGYVEDLSSPLSEIIEKTNIAKGELLLDWMMERAL